MRAEADFRQGPVAQKVGAEKQQIIMRRIQCREGGHEFARVGADPGDFLEDPARVDGDSHAHTLR